LTARYLSDIMKKKELPLFVDTLKKQPKKFKKRRNPYIDILINAPSGIIGGDKKLSHKRDRREERYIVEEELLEMDDE